MNANGKKGKYSFIEQYKIKVIISFLRLTNQVQGILALKSQLNLCPPPYSEFRIHQSLPNYLSLRLIQGPSKRVPYLSVSYCPEVVTVESYTNGIIVHIPFIFFSPLSLHCVWYLTIYTKFDILLCQRFIPSHRHLS